MKKGQIEGQIVIYVLAGFVVIMILIYGYKAIQDFNDKADTVGYIQFKKQLDSAVQSVAGDAHSEMVEEFTLPYKADKVCIVSSDGSACTGAPAVVQDSIGSGDASENIFVLKGADEVLVASTFRIENVASLTNGNIGCPTAECFNASGYTIKLTFTGTGSGTIIGQV